MNENPTISEGKNRILINNTFSKKLSWKRKESLSMAEAVKDYLSEKGFELPKRYMEFADVKPKISDEVREQIIKEVYELKLETDFDHMARYGKYVSRFKKKAKTFEVYTDNQYKKRIRKRFADMNKKLANQNLNKELEFFTDKETGECMYDEYVELARMYYTFRKFNQACYAIFQRGKSYMQQFVSAWYSKHRMDQVWNWRKSQLIRKLWRSFLMETRIYEDYKPMHLMLTVPHDKNGWNGKKFYGEELIEKFNFMRKNAKWKKYIYGGEYGLEVTRSGNNGMHIHMHCLVFQRKGYSVNEVRDFIHGQWQILTGAKIMHYESLYTFRKNEDGQFIRDKETGHKTKFYLDNSCEWFKSLKGEDRLKAYVNGVMECIKYHFKNDSVKDKDGNWDIELIKDILNNSKQLRFYSKFGAFYTEKRLNYSRIEQAAEEQSDEELAEEVDEYTEEQDLNGNVDGVEDRLINPYTLQPAKRGEYTRVIAVPELIKHMPKDAGYQPVVSNKDHNHYFEIRHDADMKEVMKAVAKGFYHEILVAQDFERFRHKTIQV